MSFNNQKVLIYLLDDQTLKFFSQNYKTYFKAFNYISKNFQNLYVVNISRIFKNKKLKIKLPKFNYFEPKTIREFNNFIKKNNCFCFNKLSYKIKYYPIFFRLKMNNVKLIQISDIILLKEKKILKKYSYVEIKNYFFYVKLNYWIYRILSILNIFPNILLHFEADVQRIKSIKNSIFWKLDPFVPIINLKFYQNVVKINSSYFEKIKKEKVEEKFIVLCDSPFLHPDTLNREGYYNYYLANKYYEKVLALLTKLRVLFKKKVIFCAHPKGIYKDIESINRIKNKFEIKNFQTEKYILKSYIAIFQVSNLINLAEYSKKKMIIITSDYLSNYTKNKISNQKKNYFKLNINKRLNFSKNYFLKKISNQYFKKKTNFKYNNEIIISRELKKY